MNGVPKKHSFSSSGGKRGKQMRGWGWGGGTTEGKDKMGGWVCVDMPGEYITALHSSTAPCDKL